MKFKCLIGYLDYFITVLLRLVYYLLSVQIALSSALGVTESMKDFLLALSGPRLGVQHEAAVLRDGTRVGGEPAGHHELPELEAEKLMQEIALQ